MRPVGDVVGLGGGTPGEALVVAEIEIGLGAVVGHEHFAVLIRRHRSGIEVEIGVELAEADLVARGPAAGHRAPPKPDPFRAKKPRRR
jgi:hypothetical protein